MQGFDTLTFAALSFLGITHLIYIPISFTLPNRSENEDGQVKFDVKNYSSADQAFLGFMLAGKENINTLPFELIVLETAFSSVISRLRRHQVTCCSLWCLVHLNLIH